MLFFIWLYGNNFVGLTKKEKENQMTLTLSSKGLQETEYASFYRENGYLVVPEAFSRQEVAALHHDTVRLCRGEAGSIEGVTPAAPGETDDEVLRCYLCIHFPHKLSPVMFDTLAHPAKSGYRRALVNHYMSAESFLPWTAPAPGENMGTLDYRDIVLVAGTDPYGYKGTEEFNTPHVRPSGEGGCATHKDNM